MSKLMVLLLSLFTFAFSLPLTSQARTIAAGVGGGIGHVPFRDWQDLLSNLEVDDIAHFYEAYMKVGFSERVALRVSAEFLSASASYSSNVYGNGDVGSVKLNYDYSSVPIGLTFEYQSAGYSASSSFFGGTGFSVYLSEVEVGVDTISDSAPSGDHSSYSALREGTGYGVHAYVGYRTRVSDSLSIQAQARGRLADGMYFDDDPGDIDVDFTGVDLTLGVEWLFR